MKSKALRLFALAPIFISLLSLLQPFITDKSLIGQLFMTPANIFGLAFVSIVWFIYFSGYRYGRQIMLVQGSISFALTGLLLIAHYLHRAGSLEKLVVAPHSAFLLNLTYVFMAGYLIQILYYWSPRTKVYINICLAIIFFMSLLSIFGHIYTFHGITQNALLLPAPFGTILSYFLLMLIIFAHTNRMDRLYLSNSIILSFAALFLAVVVANVMVYKNLSRTVDTSDQIDKTRQTLLQTYDVELYLDGAHSAAQAYESTANREDISIYQTDKRSYLEAITELHRGIPAKMNTAANQQSIAAVSNLGDRLLTTARKP